MLALPSAIVLLASAVSFVNATTSLEKRQTLCPNTIYVVPELSPAVFTDRLLVDFSASKNGEDPTTLLSQYGIEISNYPVPSKPIAHDFFRSNVVFGNNGTLDLKVNPFSQDTVGSAEILTKDVFKYASVRTVMKSSSVPGIAQGSFFYLNDNQEIDLEILTSTISNSTQCVEAGLWLTNHPSTPGGARAYETVPFTFDPTADFHEYRTDWSRNATTFYVDGKRVAELTTNIPTEEGRWIWNAWSSGDPCWSNGPPQAEAVMQIRSIELYRGYVEDGSCGAASSITLSTVPTGTESTSNQVQKTNTPSPAPKSAGYQNKMSVVVDVVVGVVLLMYTAL